MSNNQKTYWKGLEQLSNDPEFVKNAEKEFPEFLPISEQDNSGNSRRDFLKLMGFGIAAASLAACEAPVRKAIPYLNKPVDVDPSRRSFAQRRRPADTINSLGRGRRAGAAGRGNSHRCRPR